MRRAICFMLWCGMLAGCGPSGVSGGTPGLLRVGRQGVPDLQVTVHPVGDSSGEPIGFGHTGTDGRFELFQNGAKGPLWLPVGDYVCTLESTGAPFDVPPEYRLAVTSPLKVHWTGTDASLVLETPAFARIR